MTTDVKRRGRKGLTLSLTKEADGWAYEWRDTHTRTTVASGWSRGTRREGEQEAIDHLARLGRAGVRR